MGLLAALAAASLWGLWDASLANGPGLPFLRLWATTSAGSAVLAFAAWILDTALSIALAQKPLAGAWYESFSSGEKSTRKQSIRSLATLLFGSIAIFGLTLWLNKSFASATVRAMALAILLPPLLIFTGWLVKKVPGLEEESLRAGDRGLSYRTSIMLCGVLAIAWLCLIGILGRTVLKQLDLGWLAASSIFFISSGLGSLLLTKTRFTKGATGVWSGVTLLLCLWHMYSPTPNSIHFKVLQQKKTTAAHMGLGILSPDSAKAPTPPHQRRARNSSAVCLLNTAPPSPETVGRVNRNAPDIILVTVDAFRWDRTSFAEYKRDTTPKLKERLKSGALFERAYTPSVSTRQSMSSIFSGILPSLLNPPKGPKWGLTFSKEQETLVTLLNSAGYATTAVVSDKPAFSKKHGALKGFDTIDHAPVGFHKKKRHSAGFKVNRIKAALSEPYEAGKPRFVWTHLREMHWPYLTGPVGNKFGKGDSNLFDAATVFVDRELDRLLDFALSEERRENTIVLISSDHGEGFHEHGHKQHGTALYEEFIRVPWLTFGPGINPQTYSRPVSLLDVTPTLLGLAGLGVPPGFCGQNHARVLRTDERPDSRNIIVEAIPDKSKSVFELAFISEDHKLLLHPRTGIHELFNLKKDPLEKRNIADTHPELMKSLLASLKKTLKGFGMDSLYYGLK